MIFIYHSYLPSTQSLFLKMTLVSQEKKRNMELTGTSFLPPEAQEYIKRRMNDCMC